LHEISPVGAHPEHRRGDGPDTPAAGGTALGEPHGRGGHHGLRGRSAGEPPVRSAQAYWLIIAGMGLITVAIRLSMILLLGRVRLVPGISRALRFVPPAVFSALIAPALIRPAGPLDLSPGNPYLLAT